jgi:hypothetical protein
MYPTLSMSASASDPETWVTQMTLYLDISYDCVHEVGGVPIYSDGHSGAYRSAGGGEINATYPVSCSSGFPDNVSGRVRASATDSQGAIGWSAWTPIYISPF